MAKKNSARGGGIGANQGQSRERGSAAFWDKNPQSQLGSIVQKEPLVSAEKKGSEPKDTLS